VSDGLTRTILGTNASPRYGSAWSIGLLGALGLLFVLVGWLVLGIVFLALAAGAVFVRSVRGSTRR
jgi:hypothetical protein